MSPYPAHRDDRLLYERRRQYADPEDSARSRELMLLGMRGGRAVDFGLARIGAQLRKEGEERRAALRFLRDLGAGARVALDELMALVDRSFWAPDPLLIEVLCGIGLPALEALTDMARRFPHGACRIFARLGRPAARVLGSLLDGEERLRLEALRALGQIGAEVNQSTIQKVVACLDDERGLVRYRAVRALRSMPVPVERVLPRLLPLLADNRTVASGTIKTLGAFGPAARSAAPALILFLEDPQTEVRAAAARALGRVWSDEPERLLSIYEQSSRKTRMELICGVWMAGRPAVPCLIAALSERDNRTRRKALESLRLLGPEAREAEAAVRALARRSSVKGRDFQFCRRAIKAMYPEESAASARDT